MAFRRATEADADWLAELHNEHGCNDRSIVRAWLADPRVIAWVDDELHHVAMFSIDPPTKTVEAVWVLPRGASLFRLMRLLYRVFDRLEARFAGANLTGWVFTGTLHGDVAGETPARAWRAAFVRAGAPMTVEQVPGHGWRCTAALGEAATAARAWADAQAADQS